MSITVGKVMKHSLLYTYVISQPFTYYVDASPILHNNLLKADTEELQYGQHGEIVRILQHKLTNLSYYEDQIDGEFDIITEHALKKFQKDFNMDITGQATPQTVNTMIDAEKKKLLRKIDKLTESIHVGMHSEEVEIVQEALQYFGYYEGEIDGMYGPLTESALKQVETKHNLSLLDQMAGPSLEELSQLEQEKENEEKEIDKIEEETTLSTLTAKKTVENKTEEETENKQKSSNKQKQNKDAEVQQVEVKTLNNSGILQTAQSLIGTPYEWGGTAPGGFDCSGLISYIFQSNNITVPRTVNEMWNFGRHVDQPSMGDLVFFETYKPGPSHMGIYIGNGEFIHAGESRGVETSELKGTYWKDKYLGAKRIQ